MITSNMNNIDKDTYDYWMDIIYLKNGVSFCVDYDAWRDGDSWVSYYKDNMIVCQMRLGDVSAITTQRFKKIQEDNSCPYDTLS